MATSAEPRNDQLRDAFLAFNELSESLAGSYQLLERRVAELSDELAAARSERLRQLAEKERLADRLTSLLEALPGGVLVLDARGDIQECNPAAVALVGDIRIGDNWPTLVEQRLRPRPGSSQEFLLEDDRCISLSLCNLNHDGNRIVLVTDLSETRQLQDRLQRSQHLTSMGEMVAGLAHQMRTPLATTRIYMSHLRRPELEEAERLRIADRIESRVRHMEEQINDMLLFARGDQVATETLPVAQFLATLRQSVAPQTGTADVEFRIHDSAGDICIDGNETALVGAISNLVNNSLQTGVRPMYMDLSVRRGGNNNITIEFRDNGPGMPGETVTRAFKPFYTTRTEGVGLGLAVVQAVIHAHGGQVKLDSAPGRGTCFTMDLPLPADVPPMASGAGTRRRPSEETVNA